MSGGEKPFSDLPQMENLNLNFKQIKEDSTENENETVVLFIFQYINCLKLFFIYDSVRRNYGW